MKAMNNFKERRDSILALFSEAKTALEDLTTDINEQIKTNQAEIAYLSSQNAELSSINTKNAASIKALSKFF